MYPLIHILGFEIESYIVIYLIAFIVATFLLKHELKRNNYSPYLYVTLIIVGFVTGVIGSKIYYCLVTWNEFILSPFGIIFRIGGLAWYGGFILGAVSIVLTLKIKKLPIAKTLDVMIPIVPLGQVIGRIGCFLGGCCHGVPSNVPWALSFPEGLYPAHIKVHPTQLYEMLICLCIFILLWKLRKKEMGHGIKFSIYLVLTGLGRFIVEFYRFNPKVLYFLTVPQIISILCIMLGAFIITNIKRKGTNLGTI